MKRSNIFERFGVVLGTALPVLAFFFIESKTDWIVWGLYVVSAIVSLLDIAKTNKYLSLAAFLCWAMFFLLGLTVGNPQRFPFLAKILDLQKPPTASSTEVICGLAIAWAIILFMSLTEEIFIEDRQKEKK